MGLCVCVAGREGKEARENDGASKLGGSQKARTTCVWLGWGYVTFAGARHRHTKCVVVWCSIEKRYGRGRGGGG